MRQRLHWLALHAFVRAFAKIGFRLGDPHARLMADPSIRDNPALFYDELRARGPVIRSRVSHLVVDHQLAQDLLRSEHFHVVSFGASLPAPLRWLEQKTRGDLMHLLRPPSLLAVEPPDHTRYRRSVSAVFTHRAVSTWRSEIAVTATQLLTPLGAYGHDIDIVERYCSQLPIEVISDILGVPHHERGCVRAFVELAAPGLDLGLSWTQYLQVQQGISDCNQWLAEHLRRLQQAPGDDMMSQLLLSASRDGDGLNDLELQAIAGLVLAAGFETTVNLLSGGIRLLLESPESLAILREDPGLWPNAVDEILRLESPVQITPRVASCDTRLGNLRIKRGDVVIVYLAAANRDPAVFPNPHDFVVERANANRHLAFATGRHFCLGAALARAEGEVGLRAFFDYFPQARMAGVGYRRETTALRGWSTLPIRPGKACRV
jgi:cytochrome P450